jgi:steroid 5-alpha reductase family enzyme
VFWLGQGKATPVGLFSLFSFFWTNTYAATWIAVVGLPIWLVNTLPARLNPALGIRDLGALGLYTGSLLFEIIADRQKSTWRKAKDAKEHNELFISSGLWSISRHPK